ncbi:YfcE family phosphodiesterase [Paeniclostridium sordellii]|uniref:metallophosphoesterase family protein n=1 Tax=Paraclostridium sordellii TaxID=1505 RepID=UPI00054350A3|nr:metallophosphoesterase family protein [Paeniclostridium sordellii]MRZ81660.1 YfcE family phosphodiesterase [Paeniclostridium sordellii]MSB59031.1 YfcE family phosphodiesterase [Paeniclostridium sordellii]CEK36158.1 phosphoesterase subfamily,Putative metallophosphoesterase MG207 homolog,phosphodiesterase,Predicted phosphoesterase or phosphohydrolase,phosphodiesterase, MJ0936 family,Calcineurin-like phosphoesterase superfamily domain [[Clostridium] sordellii] [Paeniclostridium sordellii]
MKIGIISDTHGLLRDEVKSNLQDCDLILHAGDVGNLELINELNSITKCEFIKGNCDKKIEFENIEDNKVININGIKVYMVHDLKSIKYNLKELDIDIVVYGHSHKKNYYENDGIIYINPGSVGPKRFKLPTHMAKLEIKNNDLNNFKLDFIEI